MDIVLLTHQNWGIEAINTILKTNHKIVRVYTHPSGMDKHKKSWHKSVKNHCEELKIPVVERNNLTERDIPELKKIPIDLIFSVHWRRLLSKSIISLPKKGSINIHPALLPKYRGSSPINWTIINGEKETGITIHFIDQNADTGNIILQKKIDIESLDTAFDIYKKTIALYPSMITEVLDLIESDNYQVVNQKNLKGFFCSKRFPCDGKIDWNQDRESINNLIRGLSDPYPNAFFFFNERKILIKKAKVIEDDFRGPPGRICARKDRGIIVSCGTKFSENQSLFISEIEVDGQIYKADNFFTKLWEDLK